MIGELLWVMIGGAVLGGSAIKDARNQYRSKYNPYWWSNKHFDTDRQTYYKHLCLFEKDKVVEVTTEYTLPLQQPKGKNIVKQSRFLIVFTA